MLSAFLTAVFIPAFGAPPAPQPEPAMAVSRPFVPDPDVTGEMKVVRQFTTEKRAKAKRDAAARKEAARKKAAREKAAREKAAKEAAARKAAAAEAYSRRWVRPLSGYRITSGFGMRNGRMHPAVDLAVSSGTTVKTIGKGQVIFAGWSTEGYGYLVKIRHWNGMVTWYAHNSRVLVSKGQRVEAGQRIARSGNTGHSTGPHLHFEIHLRAGAVSPLVWMRDHGIPL